MQFYQKQQHALRTGLPKRYQTILQGGGAIVSNLALVVMSGHKYYDPRLRCINQCSVKLYFKYYYKA